MEDISILDTLPPEILIDILRQSDYRDILKFCLVSRYGNTLCRDNSLWRYLIKRDFQREYDRDMDAREQYLYLSLIYEKYGDYAFIGRLDDNPKELYERLSNDRLINSPKFRDFYRLIYDYTGTIPKFYVPKGNPIKFNIYPTPHLGSLYVVIPDDHTLNQLVVNLNQKYDYYVRKIRDVGYIIQVFVKRWV